MGVMTDYFSAADIAAVVRAMETKHGGPLINGVHSVFDGVGAKGVDADLPAVVARWAQTEELNGAGAQDLLRLARSLVALAQRARDNAQYLYCWDCL